MHFAQLALALALIAPAFQAKTTSCEAGFYVHSKNKGCYPCGDHALTCKSKGKALSCKSGYTVKDGLCKKKTANAGKTVTVTAGFAPAVTVHVTSTLLKPSKTVTVQTTSTSTKAGSTVLATTHLTGTTTSVSTVSSSTTTTSTVHATTTTTTTAATTATVRSTSRNAQLVAYGGCYSDSDMIARDGGTALVPTTSDDTLSTWLGECLAYIGDNLSSGYSTCVFGNGLALATKISGDITSFTPSGTDADCDNPCTTDAAIISEYGTEYCGSGSGGAFYSVYIVTGL